MGGGGGGGEGGGRAEGTGKIFLCRMLSEINSNSIGRGLVRSFPRRHL